MEKDTSSNNSSKDMRKETLLQAAAKLFAENGFSGTSVRDIAKAAKVNVSLVSYYFKGKEGLYRACFEEFARSRQSRAREILSPPQSVEDFRVRIQILLEDIMTFQLENPNWCKMILRELDEGLPIAAEIFEATMLTTYNTLVDFLKSAQKKGLARKELDCATAGLILQGSVFHLVRVEVIREKYFKQTLKDAKYRAKTIQQLVQQFLFGIVDAEGKPS